MLFAAVICGCWWCCCFRSCGWWWWLLLLVEVGVCGAHLFPESPAHGFPQCPRQKRQTETDSDKQRQTDRQRQTKTDRQTETLAGAGVVSFALVRQAQCMEAQFMRTPAGAHEDRSRGARDSQPHPRSHQCRGADGNLTHTAPADGRSTIPPNHSVRAPPGGPARRVGQDEHVGPATAISLFITAIDCKLRAAKGWLCAACSVR